MQEDFFVMQQNVFRDFCAHYSRLEIVNLNPDSLEEEVENTKRWEASNFEGAWVKGAEYMISFLNFSSFYIFCFSFQKVLLLEVAAII